MNIDEQSGFTLGELLPWQQDQWGRVVAQLNANSLPHAFLFEGHQGVGKNAFVRNLSMLLLCENMRPKKAQESKNETHEFHSNIKACMQCKQCKLIESDSHPDFKYIAPEENGSKIKVDQIRNLVDFFAQSSQQGGRKISIIAPAESLNINAANALLKTLEEPSSNSVLILLSHQPGMLLPTIRSRCQVLDFPTPSPQQSLDWLSKQVSMSNDVSTVERDDLAELLSLAHYAPLKALSYLEQDALSEYRKMLDELASFLKNDMLSSSVASRWNDEIAALRLAWMMKWIEQILKLKFGDSLEGVHSDNKMFIYLSEKSSHDELFELYDSCLKQFKLFLGSSNPNKILSFETLLHRWSVLMRKA